LITLKLQLAVLPAVNVQCILLQPPYQLHSRSMFKSPAQQQQPPAGL